MSRVVALSVVVGELLCAARAPAQERIKEIRKTMPQNKKCNKIMALCMPLRASY